METVVPESITDLDAAELAELEEALTAEFDKKYDGDEQAPLAELTEIADALKAVRSEVTSRVEAAEAEAVQRAELADALRVEAVEETEVEAEVVETEAVAEVVEVEAEPVAASARKAAPAAALAAREVQAPVVPTADVVITAAADIPGVPVGATLDRSALAAAFVKRSRGLADHSPRIGVASVDTGIADEFKIGPRDDADAIITAAVNSTLAGKDAAALVASGGFCAPSDNLFELFGIEGRDGLIDLPTVGISRGGINVPDYVGLDAVANALWEWTEQNDIDASTEKPCLQVPCPDFTDYRLMADGLCVTAGNFIDRAFPEQVARTLDLAMTAHLHKVSAATIGDIAATATAVSVTTVPSDAAGDILNAIDLQVADYRSQYMMSMNSVLDAIFPAHVLGMIRSTLAMRAGVPTTNVSDAEVKAHFATRNVRAQFTLDYAPLFSSAAATAWPTSTKFLLYPAGGYVKGDGGTIDLGVVRDSVLNATNDFTAAWTEQFRVTVQKGPAAREVTVASNVDGQTGGPEFGPVTAP
jgi:hypothetical protein